MVFSVLVGSGIQMLGMVMVTLIFAVLGFLSPANRGGLMSAGLVLYVWMGALAGYFSTRTYKMFKGQNWKKNTLATAFGFSGTIFGIFFVLNFFVLGAKSSAAIPVGTFFALLALWTGISLPLTFLGSYFAWRKTPPEQPVRTNQIPREVPDQVWYMNPFFSIMMGGILPFGAVFIELFFILSSVWSHQFYYLFSFLFLVFLILIITCAEISIVMCYFQLCSEDYNWWWRSYLTSGASAIYMFCYSIFYFTYLDITSFTSVVWYFGYSLVMSIIFFVMTGAIGYTSSYFFVRKIYSNIKFD
jgi:transmembrane 9 superfamily protein 2/4